MSKATYEDILSILNLSGITNSGQRVIASAGDLRFTYDGNLPIKYENITFIEILYNNDCVFLATKEKILIDDISHVRINNIAESIKKRHKPKIVRNNNIDNLLSIAYPKGRQEIRVLYPDTGYVYVFRYPSGESKIGVTTNPKNRLSALRNACPYNIGFDVLLYVDDPYSLEQALHIKFSDKRINREWFELSTEDVEYIKGLAE